METEAKPNHPIFGESEIADFLHHGFLRLDSAFSQRTAAAARERLWQEIRCDPNDRTTWTRAVVRLAGYGGGPFSEAVNTPALHAAFDQLVGVGRWVPRDGIGTFPIRFPHPDDPGDAGWHVDVSFPPNESAGTDYMKWHVNLRSRGRALLMLFLFSDVGERDAPTRIRIGSHVATARVLEPHGEEGLDAIALSAQAARASETMRETLATGSAGTVYLCHPFLVHAAQAHRGTTPRFLAQPPLEPRVPLELHREDGAYSPVERAIRIALAME